MRHYSRNGFGAGVGDAGDIFGDIFAVIEGRANQGSNSVGDIASILIGLGYTAAAISNGLEQVSMSAQASQQARALAAQERAYFQQNYSADMSRNNWVWPVVIIGVLLYLGTRKD